jgi:hypothetical protein
VNLLRLVAGSGAASGLLIGQLVFAAFFVGSCEIPNVLNRGSANACLDRWMTTAALFFPSGVAGAGTAVALDKAKRRFLG